MVPARLRQLLAHRDPSPVGSRPAHWGRRLRTAVLPRTEEEGSLCCRCCYAGAGAGAGPALGEHGKRRECPCSGVEAGRCSAVTVGAAAGSSVDVGVEQAEGSSERAAGVAAAEAVAQSAAVIVAEEARDSSAGVGAVVVEGKGSAAAVVVAVAVVAAAGDEVAGMRSRALFLVVRDKTDAGWQEVRSVGAGSCVPALSTREEGDSIGQTCQRPV